MQGMKLNFCCPRQCRTIKPSFQMVSASTSYSPYVHCCPWVLLNIQNQTSHILSVLVLVPALFPGRLAYIPFPWQRTSFCRSGFCRDPHLLPGVVNTF